MGWVDDHAHFALGVADMVAADGTLESRFAAIQYLFAVLLQHIDDLSAKQSDPPKRAELRIESTDCDEVAGV